MSAESSPYNATLTAREDINPQLSVLRIQPDGPMFDFTPGQFGVIGLLGREERVADADPEETPPPADKLIKRAYSLASSSFEKTHVELYVTLVHSGQLTPRLFARPRGARIFLSPKASGVFTLDRVGEARSVVLVATGTGLAPYISMLRTQLIRDTTRRYVVLHGARHSWDLGYRGELETLARIRPNFTYIPSITRAEQDPHFRGAVGRVQALLTEGLIEQRSGVAVTPEATDVFLCGHPDMIKATKEILATRGFVSDLPKKPGNLHVEEYW